MITPEMWMPADGFMLEPNAMTAATEMERCLALTAGPGAGKTEMLAQRADFLLQTGTCRYPKRILAISFKVDASRNLKERVQKRCGVDLASRFDSYTFHAFAKRIIDRFRPVLTGQSALDPDFSIGDRRISRKKIQFADLIPLALEILQTSQVACNAIRKTYSDVFLDEFQDCTGYQYALVRLAFKSTNIRLTAVGDTRQRIMGWAGALEGIFLNFAKDFNAISLNMYLNFRSKPRLLRMQNEMIRVLDPASVMPADQIIGDEGEIISVNFDNSLLEADYLADQVHNWIFDEGIPLSEIAILISKQPELYADFLMAEFEKRGIPFRNEQQLQDLSTEPVSRLIVDYLLSIYGSREPAAWLRLMDRLIPFSDEREQINMRQGWQQFINTQMKEAVLLTEKKGTWPDIWGLVIVFLNKVGKNNLTALSPDYESFSRLKEVVSETKSRISELLNIEPELIKALARFSEEKAVSILTIHKSKGLEFDSVVILGVENELFWGTLDEERCAFFVGMSRAKRRLFLTTCEQRRRPSGASRWAETRTQQNEFLGYAKPFL